ncbi:MAG: ArnT family glycosyltransferase [Lautropia sp.]
MATRRRKATPRGERALFVLVLLAVIAILFARLGTAPLADVDEGAFSEATREMLVRGDLVSPWLLDAPRFDKPVLFHWLQMPFIVLLGAEPLAARLPSALAGLASVLAVAAWAWSLSGRDLLAAAFGASIASTSLAVPVIARVATADATLNALLAIALLASWHALFTRQQVHARRFARVAAAAIALGLLAKGPIALLVPAICVPLAAWWSARGARLGHLLLDPIAWALLVLLALPWYLLQWRAMGAAFIDGFFGTHNVGRFLAPMHGFDHGPGYYPIVLLLALLPWTTLLVRAVAGALRDPSHPFRDRAFGLAWIPAVFVLLFFSFSATKLPHYLFYGIGGLFAALGALAAGMSRSDARFGWERAVCGVMLIACASLPWWWPSVADAIPDAFHRQAARDAAVVLGGYRAWLVGLGCAGLAIAVLAPARQAVLGAATVLAIALHLVVVPAGLAGLQDPVVAAAERVAHLRTRVITWRLDVPSLSFAAGRVVRAGDPAIGDTVVLRVDRRDALAQALAGGTPRASLRMQWRMGGIEIAEVVAR